jgi:hypothetical protein
MSNFSLQIGDGSVKNGAARGADSIDLQLTRTTPYQVASGRGSMIVGGANNTANGLYAAVMGGYGNTSIGTYAVTGGAGNIASGEASIALGAGNEATAQGSAAIGLENNANAQASIAIGNGNTTAAISSAIINSVGSATFSTAPYSTIIGGAGGLSYLPGQLITNPRSQYGGAGTFQVSELLVFREVSQSAGAFSAIQYTLDGLPPAVTNELIINSANKVWQVVSEWMLINQTTSQVVVGKDLVVVHKVGGFVRLVNSTNISKTGDFSMTSVWNAVYNTANDMSVTLIPTGGSSLGTTVFRGSAKLTITELKSN